MCVNCPLLMYMYIYMNGRIFRYLNTHFTHKDIYFVVCEKTCCGVTDEHFL